MKAAVTVGRRALGGLFLLVFFLVSPLSVSARVQASPEAAAASAPYDPASFQSAQARDLHESASEAMRRIEREVVSYTALVRERLAADLRLPLRDRTIVRQEGASRVFWSRDGEVLVQALGARSQTPDDDDDEDFRSTTIFDPSSDRLSFGIMGNQRGEVWFHHPLGADWAEHYTFRTGETITLTLPDGRGLRAVELQVVPTSPDFRRISGSLWIEPETGGLVRAVYRLSSQLDVEEDIEDAEGMRFVPGLFRPFTFDLQMVAVEYTLWDFRVWLPRSMRMEGLFAAGIVKVPAAVEVSYGMESVVTEADVAAGTVVGPDVVEERHFRTRSEALAYLAELAAASGVAYQSDETTRSRSNGRTVRYLLPQDLSVLGQSRDLPPPIWDDAPGFVGRDQLSELMDRLAALPRPSSEGFRWTWNWGPQRADLMRYNRVEGLALGARLQLLMGSPVGPVSLGLTPFLGTSDLKPKATLTATRETLRQRASLSAYHDIEAVSRQGRHLGPGNSAMALLFGRDDGEYFLTTGVDLRVSPPAARRAWWEARLWAERHSALATETSFALTRAFSDEWRFRPNFTASPQREVGASLLLSPWWGTDPSAPQAGVELFVQGAAGLRRAAGEGANSADYGRASLTLRGIVPLPVGGLRAGAELAAGEHLGALPLQRAWFLGGAQTLRGFQASTLVGASFLRSRVEVTRPLGAGALAVFSDAGWVGDGVSRFSQRDALVSAGLGLSLLDGVLRLDVARGLRRGQGFRWDFYLDGIL